MTDEQQQSQYIKMFKEQSQDAVILTHNIDTPFITYMEQHNENIKFQRIDADVHDSLERRGDGGRKRESFGRQPKVLLRFSEKSWTMKSLTLKWRN